jgi:hypothetical protein
LVRCTDAVFAQAVVRPDVFAAGTVYFNQYLEHLPAVA